jgi:hypothetical protein
MKDDIDTSWEDFKTDCAHRSQTAEAFLQALKAVPGLDRSAQDNAASALAKAAAVPAPRIEDAAEFLAYAQAQDNISLSVKELLKACEDKAPIKLDANLYELYLGLAETQSRTAAERAFYASQSIQYQAWLKRFPGNIVGPRKGFRPRPLLPSPKAKPAPKS